MRLTNLVARLDFFRPFSELGTRFCVSGPLGSLATLKSARGRLIERLVPPNTTYESLYFGVSLNMEFPIAIHKDPTSIFGVTIPDVPGCYSSGETIEDAIRNARGAVISHVEALQSLGETVVLVPTPIAKLEMQPEFADAIWVLADVDISALKVKRRR